MPADAISSSRRSTFLTALPPEIRNDICERLLVHKRPIKIARGQSEASTRTLLNVCRQLKNEFSPLYYANNVFTCQCTESDLDRKLDWTSSLIKWLQRIGMHNRGMLREIQIRLVNTRSLSKEDLFAFVRDQNVRIALEGIWLPLRVLQIRFQEHWLNQLELSEAILNEEHNDEVHALIENGSSLAKGPDLRIWKRDIYDPVIDKFSKPGKRQLSEFVCPANWRWYARSEASIQLCEAEEPVKAEEEKEGETGCLSGSIKVLVAKVRKGKGVVTRFRKWRDRQKD